MPWWAWCLVGAGVVALIGGGMYVWVMYQVGKSLMKW